MWTGLLVLLFVAVTALTLLVWFAEPSAAPTNPVLDLAFFTLGVVLAAGFASQVRGREPAGVLQALVAAGALAGAGLMGQRIEPAVGGLVLVGAAVVLGLLPPRPRWQLVTHRGRIPLAVAAALAAVPAGMYAADMLRSAAAAGPSCFLGRCATGDRPAEAAAVALTTVLLVVVAAIGVRGWLLCAWSSGLAAVLLGIVSIVLPDELGSLGRATAVMALVWGAAVVVAGVDSQRRSGRRPT